MVKQIKCEQTSLLLRKKRYLFYYKLDFYFNDFAFHFASQFLDFNSQPKS